MERVLHRVEVIEVAEELIEAVHRRQDTRCGRRDGSCRTGRWRSPALLSTVAMVGACGRHADRGAGLADGGQAGADRQLAGDEVGAAGGAARLGVVVGEEHAFGGELVEVRRLARHHAAVVGADVEPADVVAHDEEDVRFLGVLGRRWPGREGRSGGECGAEENAAPREALPGTRVCNVNAGLLVFAAHFPLLVPQMKAPVPDASASCDWAAIQCGAFSSALPTVRLSDADGIEVT